MNTQTPHQSSLNVMYSVIVDCLAWQRNDARISPLPDEAGFVVYPQKHVLADTSWARIFEGSMQKTGYTVTFLDNYWGRPAVRIEFES